MVTTTRFGDVAVAPEDIWHFRDGLIGLSGTEYALMPAGDSPFRWLQSLSDPAIALPLTRPERFFPDFALALGEEDDDVEDIAEASEVYVTVRAASAAADCTANLKAPIVVCGEAGVEGRQARQVINQAPGSDLRAPLFTLR